MDCSTCSPFMNLAMRLPPKIEKRNRIGCKTYPQGNQNITNAAICFYPSDSASSITKKPPAMDILPPNYINEPKIFFGALL
jgi:hypothetical protein